MTKMPQEHVRNTKITMSLCRLIFNILSSHLFVWYSLTRCPKLQLGQNCHPQIDESPCFLMLILRRLEILFLLIYLVILYGCGWTKIEFTSALYKSSWIMQEHADNLWEVKRKYKSGFSEKIIGAA